MAAFLSFEKLQTLTHEEILTGITATHETAQGNFICGQFLAEREFYGQASSMTVLAIEELMKGFGMIAFLFGVPDRNLIDACLKGIKPLGNAHQSRLRSAGFLGIVHACMDKKRMQEMLLDQIQQLKEEIGPLKNMEEVIEKVVPRLTFSGDLLLSETALNQVYEQLNSLENWFAKANTLKQRGLYCDLTANNLWNKPHTITKQDYEESKSYFTQVNDTVGTMLKESTSSTSNFNFYRAVVLSYSEANRMSKLNR